MLKFSLVRSSQIFLFLVIWFQVNVSINAQVVYSNNFNNGTASLSDFTIRTVAGNIGTYSVTADSGQLKIATGNTTPCYGFAVINTANFAAPYQTTLKNNSGLVSWSFNVSNLDGQWNNSFYFTLASNSSDPLVYTSTSYVFAGGGYVGNRMMIFRQGYNPSDHTHIIDITNGLPIGYNGSIRITYDPKTDIWSLYGVWGSSYVAPELVANLLGTCHDSTYTGLNLPYMGMGGSTSGIDYFDNLTVSVVPEPATILLLTLGGLVLRRKK
ncbi:MAG: PEP-CTERM sorting domain-containing protein [Phycisphaerae bacterium]|jgi:hypothetical protein